jgi:hypothetical protein
MTSEIVYCCAACGAAVNWHTKDDTMRAFEQHGVWGRQIGDLDIAAPYGLTDTGARSIRYIYDFGDNWEHQLQIGKVTDPRPGDLYPRLTEVSGQ